MTTDCQFGWQQIPKNMKTRIYKGNNMEPTYLETQSVNITSHFSAGKQAHSISERD